MFSELKAYFQDMSVYKKIICVLCVFLSGYDLLAATVIRINYWVHYPMNLLIAALVICLTSMEKRGKVSIGYIFDARDRPFRSLLDWVLHDQLQRDAVPHNQAHRL